MEINDYTFLKVVILPILLFNPVMVFLLTGSVLTSIILPFSVVLIFYLSDHFYKALKVFVVNFLFLFSILIHTELLFKFGFSEYIIENLYEIRSGYYFNKPNLVKDIQDKEYNVLYKTNNQGFRMPAAISQDKEIKECDWMFIGDSFTQGAQVEFRDLFTSQIYRNHPDKIIVNAGISGFGILDELEYYKNEGYKLKPQKVILQLCSFNDFMKVKIKRNSFSEYLMQYSDFARFLLYGIKYKNPGELPLGRWTEPFYPTEQENSDFNIFYKNKSSQKKEDIKRFIETLLEFKREVEKNDSQFFVFLIPTKEQVYPRYLDEVKSAFGISDNQLDLFAPNHLMNQLCDSSSISFIDLLPGYLDGQEAIFYEYDEHLNRYGHYLTAQLLEPFFKDQIPDNQLRLVSDNFLGERYPSCWEEKLILQANRDGNMEIVIKDFLGGSENRLTYNDIDETHPSLNDQRALMAFTEGDAATMKTKVGFLDLNTMSRFYLDNDPNNFSAIPSFSFDGDFVTYTEWKWDSKVKKFTLPSIAVSKIDDLGIKIHEIKREDAELWRPIFTPDGSSIIYISNEAGNYNIFITELSTGNTSQLTNTEYDEWDPFISSDGKKLVYAAKIDGNWDLVEMNLETRMENRLTNSIGDEWDPQYCSSSKDLIYAGEFGFYSCIYKKAL